MVSNQAKGTSTRFGCPFESKVSVDSICEHLCPEMFFSKIGLSSRLALHFEQPRNMKEFVRLPPKLQGCTDSLLGRPAIAPISSPLGCSLVRLIAGRTVFNYGVLAASLCSRAWLPYGKQSIQIWATGIA